MNTAKNIVKNWREDEALERFRLISPLLEDDLDTAKKLKIREEIAERNNISVRSVYRYEQLYREEGFEGLKPSPKIGLNHKLPEGFDSLLQDAIQLRKEVPKRSVNQLILILELEGKVAPGILKRSTLERHLCRAGYGSDQLKMYADSRESSSKRFCKPHRMMLIQGDIKYGPILPIGKNGARVQTYLSSAIDDHSRFILSSEFYASQEEIVVEDTFRKAILRHGKFDSCYFDNGSQYTAKQLKLSLSKLGITIRHAKIRSGKSKGKVEKFHQVVDSFLREAKLKKIKTLEELNRLWKIYLEEYYNKSPHAGIKEYYESYNISVPDCGITPEQEFNRDTRPLTYIDTSVVAEAFLHHEKRKVDKGACISFRGKKYETKPSLIGYEVEIAYDPVSPEIITVYYKGMEPFTSKPVCIGEYCDRDDTLPEPVLLNEAPATSRLLDALEKKHEQSKKQLADAISFASYRKEANKDV